MRQIYLGEIIHWSEVGGPDRAIAVVVRGKNSGTHGDFDDIALQGEEPAAPDMRTAVTAGDVAAAEAVLPLGEVWVVAPDRQWSGGGRSMPPDVTGRLLPSSRELGGQRVNAFAVDASPALAVVHGVVELTPRQPSLVISGINLGANLGVEVTVSGTVGAALEAGAFDIPALAVSLEIESARHLTGGDGIDYRAAMAFTQRLARRLLNHRLPYDVDALNANIPSDATPQTPCRTTRLSRHRYFVPLPPDRDNGQGRPGYELIQDPRETEVDSDVWAVLVDRVVAVTPLSLDLTSRGCFRSDYTDGPTAQPDTVSF